MEREPHATPVRWEGEITRRRLLEAAGVVGLGAMIPGVLAGCGGSSKHGASDTNGTPATSGSAGETASIAHLDVINTTMPDRLSGEHLVAGLGAMVLLSCEAALLVDSQGNVQPNLAKFEQPNPTTVVLTFRDGVKFWDGTPLTLEDVVYSYRLVQSKKATLSSYWSSVKSMKPSGNTLTIKLAEPNAQFLYGITYTPIVSKAYGTKHGDAIGSPSVLNMGTGPWKFREFKPGDSISYVANDGYWGGKPSIEQITVRLVTDSSTALLSVRSKEVTANLVVPAAEYKQYADIDGVRVQKGSSAEVGMFWADSRKKPFDDVHVRRAIQHCVDRSKIIDGALRGLGSPAITLPVKEQLARVLTSQQMGRVWSRLEELTAYDLDMARRELSQSSVPKGFSFEVAATQTESTVVRAMQVLAQSLQQIGLHLTVKEVSPSQYQQDIFSHTQQFMVLTGTPETPDPGFYPMLLFSSWERAPKGVYNLAEFSSPEIDKAVRQLTQIPLSGSSRQRGELISKILLHNAEQALYQPMYHPTALLAVDDSYEYKDWNAQWFMTRWPNHFVTA